MAEKITTFIESLYIFTIYLFFVLSEIDSLGFQKHNNIESFWTYSLIGLGFCIIGSVIYKLWRKR